MFYMALQAKEIFNVPVNQRHARKEIQDPFLFVFFSLTISIFYYLLAVLGILLSLLSLFLFFCTCYLFVSL